MGYATWIADQCRLWVPVEEYAGWTSRGSSSFTPGGVVCHWTAGPCDSTGRPSLHTCVNGREGLSGPLCNVYLDRAGVAVIVAAGRANHAGDGGWRGLSGNSSVLGIEAECCNAGDWTPAQRNAYPRLVAALLAGLHRDASSACGHNEWAPTRKIDIHDWTMPTMRAEVAALLTGGPVAPVPPPTGDDDEVKPEDVTAIVDAVVAALGPRIDEATGWSRQAATDADAASSNADRAATYASRAVEVSTLGLSATVDAVDAAVDGLYVASTGRTVDELPGTDLDDLDDEAVVRTMRDLPML